VNHKAVSKGHNVSLLSFKYYNFMLLLTACCCYVYAYDSTSWANGSHVSVYAVLRPGQL